MALVCPILKRRARSTVALKTARPFGNRREIYVRDNFPEIDMIATIGRGHASRQTRNRE